MRMSEKTWKRIDVVFELKSPLHIGYLPFTLVTSPTRYYVPGKNLWGAVTKEATENLFSLPDAKNYQVVGKSIKKNFIFSYFYLYDGEVTYIPEYTKDGLKFGNKKPMDESDFERRFIGSRVLTEIDKNTGTAKNESLHEIEFINDKFRDKCGNVRNTKLIGCIWVKKNAKIEDKEIIINNKGIFIGDFNIVRELILGGESKYGFGMVKLLSMNEEKFPVETEEVDEVKIKIRGKSLPFPLEYDKCIPSKDDKGIHFDGEIELIGGREYPTNDGAKRYENPGRKLVTQTYYFSPGTIIRNIKNENEREFILEWNGTMN